MQKLSKKLLPLYIHFLLQVRSKSMEQGEDEVYETELSQLFSEEDGVKLVEWHIFITNFLFPFFKQIFSISYHVKLFAQASHHVHYFRVSFILFFLTNFIYGVRICVAADIFFAIG